MRAFNSVKARSEWDRLIKEINGITSDDQASVEAKLSLMLNAVHLVVSPKTQQSLVGEIANLRRKVAQFRAAPDEDAEKAAKEFDKLTKKLSEIQSSLITSRRVDEAAPIGYAKKDLRNVQDTLKGQLVAVRKLLNDLPNDTELITTRDFLFQAAREVQRGNKIIAEGFIKEAFRLRSDLKDNLESLTDERSRRKQEYEQLRESIFGKRRSLQDILLSVARATATGTMAVLDRVGYKGLNVGNLLRGVAWGVDAVGATGRGMYRGVQSLYRAGRTVAHEIQDRRAERSALKFATAKTEGEDNFESVKSENEKQHKSKMARLLERQVNLLRELTKRGNGTDQAAGGSGGILKSILGLFGAGGLAGLLSGGLTTAALGVLKAGLFTLLKTGVVKALPMLLRFLPRLFGPLGLGLLIYEAVSLVWKYYGEDIKEMYATASTWVKEKMGQVSDFLGRVAQPIKEFFGDPMKFIKDKWNALTEKLESIPFLKSAMEIGKKALDWTPVKMIHDAASGNLGSNHAFQSVSAAVDATSGALQSGVQFAKEKTAPIVQAASSGVSSAASAVSEYVGSKFRSMRDAVGNLFRTGGNVNLEGIQPGVQANFLGMAEEYKARGGKGTIQVNSGYRSYEEQKRLYELNPRRAAPPGRSLHGTGLAIDINRREANELDNMGLLSKYGFSRPIKDEPWHLQVAGSAPAAAKAGLSNADFPGNDSPDSTSNTRPMPTRTSSPTAQPYSQGTDSDAVERRFGNQMPRSSGAAPMSVDSVPTFSFNDPMFFAANLGVVAP